MKFGMYTIKDTVAKEAAPPFFAVNDGVAMRQFKAMIKGSEAPGDFELYSLGVFDTETMLVYTQPDLYPARMDNVAVAFGGKE